jgi:oxalate decarboxylase/phosphoglucose isomerase-like protein (cupin superfamily)
MPASKLGIMFVKQVSSIAKFAPDRMGKSTIAQGDSLFAGLNSFEPGQEHAAHAHEGQDKLYVILEGCVANSGVTANAKSGSHSITQQCRKSHA